MLVDVLVLVVLVDGELHAGHLGQHPLGETGLDHGVDRLDRELAADQFVQLGTDAFDGDAFDLAVHVGDRLPHARREPESQLRDEPHGAEHPERVVAEGLCRRGGGVDDPGQQGGHPVERVPEVLGARRADPDRHRVDGEVPSDQVVVEGLAERDLGIAADLVIRVRAKRRDLDQVVALADPDRAELDADVPERVGPAAEELRHRFRARIGREVEVVAQTPENRVAHRAAHQVQLVAGGLEQLAEGHEDVVEVAQCDRRGGEQAGAPFRVRRVHLVRLGCPIPEWPRRRRTGRGSVVHGLPPYRRDPRRRRRTARRRRLIHPRRTRDTANPQPTRPRRRPDKLQVTSR